MIRRIKSLRYKILEGITTADVAYEVYGKTIEELFENAALAVEETMVDITTVRPLRNFQFSIIPGLAKRGGAGNFQLEDLLLDFLNELLFYKDSQGIIFCTFNIKIKKVNKKYELIADIVGEKADPKKHKLRADVKAVTRYHLEIKRSNNQYIATVVLDI